MWRWRSNSLPGAIAPRQVSISDAPVHPLQHALKDLERAYKNFFAKRADFPRFKKKGMGDSFRYPDAKQFKIDADNSRVFLPKLGWLRYRNSREMLGTAKNITVSSTDGKWFVSIQTEREEAEPVHPSTSIVCVDVGIARFACVECGFEENADLVGAINILAAGHAVLACGGMAQSGRPAKQEPAEAT